jgi:ABC-type glycerol-3-phosphate transport system substrate-binding protein
MKKIKMMLMASAFIIALAGAFAFSSPSGNAKTYTTYHYDSDSYALEDMQDVENWKESGPGCDAEGNVPCTINFDGDKEALGTFLGVRDEEEILTAASARRIVAQ